MFRFSFFFDLLTTYFVGAGSVGNGAVRAVFDYRALVMLAFRYDQACSGEERHHGATDARGSLLSTHGKWGEVVRRFN